MPVPPRIPSSRVALTTTNDGLITREWFRFLFNMETWASTQELYARVQNTTGSTIPKGTVVGFAGVGPNNVLSVAPYLADGATPTLYILGVMAEDVPDSGQIGLCCVWGHVSGIDTSAFSVGAVLYASPTVAGAFTATKPTAPNNVIPVAATLSSNATTGEIFVRPTIEQQKYYGEFSRTTDLTAAVADTAYAIALDTTEIAEGVVLEGSPLTRIKVPESGLYQFSARYQFSSSNASSKNARVWFRKNGTTNYANSTSIASLDSNSAYASITASEFFSLQANDYLELMWAVSDTALALDAVAATAYAPSAPAVLLTVTQIQQ